MAFSSTHYFNLTHFIMRFSCTSMHAIISDILYLCNYLLKRFDNGPCNLPADIQWSFMIFIPDFVLILQEYD